MSDPYAREGHDRIDGTCQSCRNVMRWRRRVVERPPGPYKDD